MKIRAADERRENADGKQNEPLWGKRRSFTKRSRLGKLLILLGRSCIFVRTDLRVSLSRSKRVLVDGFLLQNELDADTGRSAKRIRTYGLPFYKTNRRFVAKYKTNRRPRVSLSRIVFSTDLINSSSRLFRSSYSRRGVMTTRKRLILKSKNVVTDLYRALVPDWVGWRSGWCVISPVWRWSRRGRRPFAAGGLFAGGLRAWRWPVRCMPGGSCPFARGLR
jgi:hypothetical protein